MRDFRGNARERFGRGNSNRPGRRFDNNSSRSSERPGRRGFSRPNRNSELEMHRVICDKCGKECEVPFKPTGDKPVYCSSCFRKNDNYEPKGRGNQSTGDLAEINMKLDKILKALNID